MSNKVVIRQLQNLSKENKLSGSISLRLHPGFEMETDPMELSLSREGKVSVQSCLLFQSFLWLSLDRLSNFESGGCAIVGLLFLGLCLFVLDN